MMAKKQKTTRQKPQKPTDVPDELRAPLLEAALPHVPFDGWTDHILTLAARDLNLDPALARLAFPGGAQDMIDLLAQIHDQKMVAACPEERLRELKVRDKITRLVRARVTAEQEHREAARSAVTYLALPLNSPLGLKILYRTVDLMWKRIGDPSTDFNFYTKRLTLSAVYSATLLYWFNDESEDYAETWAFLDRRISDVMTFEKTKAQANDQIGKLKRNLPDFWKGLGRLRYPRDQ